MIIGIANGEIQDHFVFSKFDKNTEHFHTTSWWLWPDVPDGLPNWLLREFASLVAFPVKTILNASFSEQRLPSPWKYADVTPLPKKTPVQNLKKDLRPISLTPCLSKVAEDFVVTDHLKPAVMQVLDSYQYGADPKSSTTIPLLSMIHEVDHRN
ncbi:uncharacterized protein LOC141891636 [Acropora palmata]|uniref:uncharacterized protein LOC141891636 n=1 Tax=Acropora palmata TaxID=6131 RepID=UPI003DA116D1